ncbi:hemolysin family protein [Cytobacillus gottheilii]|uniref:HlyC/CorC family transporter n=1 Tax=Cytobacillus gottheilii TaxID=859144 RepID=A0ABX8FBM4_9BACI|nr:hemolysin family protein [Cytobacillus gottheilii]QVY61769.1 HlyC/CorC family transporter [Cytobacillus gottheilii]
MDNIGISILIILILIVANGLFAMTEIAIVTSKKARLERMRDEGNNKAAYALKLAEDPNQLLSTIQIGITLIGVITGAFGGATIARQLSVYVEQIDFLAPYSYQLSFIIVVGISTYLSLIIGELVPKRIGLGNPEKVASAVAKPMYYFSKIGRPLIWILSKSTELLLKILGIKPNNEPNVTEEEITQLIEEGVYSGVVEEIEQDIVEQVFYLGDKRLSDILTTRTKLIWLDIEDSFQENMKMINESPHSKFPVGKGSLDRFLGIIHTKDLLSKVAGGEKFDLADCIEDTHILPEYMKVFHVLEILKKSGKHEAVVTDEYGGIEGFVTLHDIIENIVGDMPEDDEEVPQIIKRNEDTWLADGLVSIDAFIRYFDLEDSSLLKDRSHYHTIGGLFAYIIGNLPKIKDTIQVEDLEIEVIDMDGARLDKLLITKLNTEKDIEEE